MEVKEKEESSLKESAEDDSAVGDESDEEQAEEELVDLPMGIQEQLIEGEDREFRSEEELFRALVDARVVLVDGKARLVTPSDQHNVFTSACVANFHHRRNSEIWGKWGS